MDKIENILHASKVLISVAVAAGANSATAGVSSIVGGGFSVLALIKSFGDKSTDLERKIAEQLGEALGRKSHLSEASRLLIPQMIAATAPTPKAIIDAQRDPERICREMLVGLKDPAHNTALVKVDFVRVVSKIFETLLEDVDVNDVLRPAFETAVVEQLAHIRDQVDRLVAGSDEAARKFGIKEGMLMALARRYAEGDATDFDSALRGLERAFEVVAEEKARGELPSNLGEAVDAVLKRMAELNEAGELDAAAAEVDRALEAAEAEGEAVEARKVALLEAGVEQDILRRNPTSAAARLVARLGLEVAEPGARFAALRALRREWYERGRDKGLNFDAEVAVALARASVDLAQGADQRGTALNDLGLALQTLGEREAGTGRLNDAVTAFRDALKEWTRERVPLDWAMAQMNLGNALATLGEREAGTGRLDEAVSAYRDALKEQTRERVPLDWAMTQMNLGNALQTLGAREAGTGRLDEAVAAYRDALKERTCERVPLEWATAQMNLGNALRALGEREAGTGRLDDAVSAYRDALKEYTRERVPLDWAMAQMNLGNALQTLGAREAGTGRLDEAVAAYRDALKERTRERVPLDWALSQMNLGNALAILGEREAGTGRLDEAVSAYRDALKERTRDRVPLQWANVQFNLADVECAYFDKAGDVARLDAAEANARAALEVFEGAPERASMYRWLSDYWRRSRRSGGRSRVKADCI